MKTHLRSITSNQLKADFFVQLSRMESAGLPLQQTLAFLKKENSVLTPNLTLFDRLITQGKPISDSGYKAKLFSAIDKAIIAAGETSGNLATVYEQLATHYSNRYRYSQQIKSKLILPLLVLIVFLFVQPLPGLVAGTLSVSDYLKMTVGTLLSLAMLFYITINITSWLSIAALQKFRLKYLIDRLSLSLPMICSWLISRQLNTFFSYLGLLLSSGVSVDEALATAITTINNQVLKAKFSPVASLVKQGNSLAEALRRVPEIEQTTIQQLVIGEESGRLDQTLQHLTAFQSRALAEQDAFIVEWIPRIIYFIIMVLVAYTLITSTSISSIPPAD